MTTQAETGLEPYHDLTGKVVFVTGASSGLGKEFFFDLANAGCKVIACARRIDLLKSMCDEINGAGSDQVRAVVMQLDVSAEEKVIEAAVQKAWDAFGHIDALINNAGIAGNPKNPLDLEEKEWEYLFRTNLTGAWLIAKHVGLRMRKAKRSGSIINISSVAGSNRVFLPGAAAYASSKAAMNTMTKIMAMELGVYNIRVNSISPGILRSEITQGLVNKDWFHKVGMKTVPLQTIGTINPALTALARYLIHDSSMYVTGSCFIADSGASLVGLPIFASL